jgi:HrpA-like RNA helicase
MSSSSIDDIQSMINKVNSLYNDIFGTVIETKTEKQPSSVIEETEIIEKEENNETEKQPSISDEIDPEFVFSIENVYDEKQTVNSGAGDDSIPSRTIDDETKNILTQTKFNFNNFLKRMRESQKKEEKTIDFSVISHLPINAVREHIMECLNEKDHLPIVIGAPTGAGKTVGMSVYLLEHIMKNRKQRAYIALPTRASVLSSKSSLKYFFGDVAEDEMYFGYAQNREVSYNHDTYVKIGTTRHVINVLGKLLSDEDKHHHFENMIVMVDEAHYQNADTRVLLLMCSYIYKITEGKFCPIIASATLDNAPIHDLFSKKIVPHMISTPGRVHPIKVEYHYRDYELSDKESILVATVTKASNIINDKHSTPSTIIIFVPGESEMNYVITQIEAVLPKIECLRAYGGMSTEEYELLFTTSTDWRIIVATNVAETSVTIDGVSYVIDTLLHKVAKMTKFGRQITDSFISYPASVQRKGRTGRLCAGVYLPIATKKGMDELKPYDVNELELIHPDDYIILFMKYGLTLTQIYHLLKLDATYLKERIRYLVKIKMIEKNEKNDFVVSKLGMRVSELPTSIEHAIALYSLHEESETIQMLACAIIAMVDATQGNGIFWIPHDKREESMSYMRENFDRFIGRTDTETNLKVFLAYMNEKDLTSKWSNYCSINNKIIRQSMKNFITLTSILSLPNAFTPEHYTEMGFKIEDLKPFAIHDGHGAYYVGRDYSKVDFNIDLMITIGKAFALSLPDQLYEYRGGNTFTQRTKEGTYRNVQLDKKRGFSWGCEGYHHETSLESDVYQGFVPKEFFICLNVMEIKFFKHGLEQSFTTATWILPC